MAITMLFFAVKHSNSLIVYMQLIVFTIQTHKQINRAHELRFKLFSFSLMFLLLSFSSIQFTLSLSLSLISVTLSIVWHLFCLSHYDRLFQGKCLLCDRKFMSINKQTNKYTQPELDTCSDAFCFQRCKINSREIHRLSWHLILWMNSIENWMHDWKICVKQNTVLLYSGKFIYFSHFFVISSLLTFIYSRNSIISIR